MQIWLKLVHYFPNKNPKQDTRVRNLETFNMRKLYKNALHWTVNMAHCFFSMSTVDYWGEYLTFHGLNDLLINNQYCNVVALKITLCVDDLIGLWIVQ